MIKVPVTRTENASIVMKCETGNARDYTNAKGKQLLTYLQSESKNYGPVFVVGSVVKKKKGNTVRKEERRR